jgi:hypothetical protein
MGTLAATAGPQVPLAWVSAAVGVVGVLVAVAKGSRIFGAMEQHLKEQDKTLAAQDEALKQLDTKLDVLGEGGPHDAA